MSAPPVMLNVSVSAEGRNKMQDLTSAGARQGKPKNRMIALFLSLFLGLLGADRFYLGKRKTGILKALTIGGLGIWWVVDSALLGLDALLYTFGRNTGFVKDSKNRDLVHGIALYRLKDGRLERDWFAGR